VTGHRKDRFHPLLIVKKILKLTFPKKLSYYLFSNPPSQGMELYVVKVFVFYSRKDIEF